MLKFLTGINQMLWGWGLIGLLLGTGIFCLIYPGWDCLKSFQLLFRKPKTSSQAGGVFESCMTSLAAAMGTGNIIGVATALTLGGAGAVFWMWISAFCGMGLIYAENVLSCRYRAGHCSGAAAYLRYGLKSPRLANVFAVCCVAASFGMGNMTQSHAMADILHASFDVPVWMTGLVTAVLMGIIILGGSGRIGKFAGLVIPVLTGLYLILSFLILIRFRGNLGHVLKEIFQNAFGISAIGGGVSGMAVKHAVSVGVRRGIFSNEAGLGSSGLLHAEANTDNPRFLGLCGMMEVIIDTFLCCTVTAFVILSTGVLGTGQTGAVLVLSAFRAGIGNSAGWVLPPMIALFAFCTLIGWSFCGMNALRSLTNGHYLKTYQIIFCMAAALGAVMQLELVWTLADIANACMAYCNLPGILFLYPQKENAVSFKTTGRSL